MYNQTHLIAGAGSETPTRASSHSPGWHSLYLGQSNTPSISVTPTTVDCVLDCGLGFPPSSLLKLHPSQMLPSTSKVWATYGGEAWEVQVHSPTACHTQPWREHGGTKKLGCEFANATFGCHTSICSSPYLPWGLSTPNASLSSTRTNFRTGLGEEAEQDELTWLR